MKRLAAGLAVMLWSAMTGWAGPSTEPAAQAINALGCDLLARSSGNALLSPYSIQTALAMTYAGAAGATRDEMMQVLHFPADEDELHGAFSQLQAELDEMTRLTKARMEQDKKFGGGGDPITLSVANRLFGQVGYEFRAPFLKLVDTLYHAPLQPADFQRDPAHETSVINRWVEQQTRERIRDLIPAGALTRDTGLVLVNALYLKAPWEQKFNDVSTKPAPFHVAGGSPVDVPTMNRLGDLGYAKEDGCTVVSVPYLGRFLQLLLVLPDDPAGLPALEKSVTAERLAAWAGLRAREVNLYLPKFRLEPPVLKLAETLQALGMRRAFDVPAGSADFDRMAPRRPDDYLYISEVFHKTFLALDEKGTEAAAATAVAMARATAMPIAKPEPVVVRVDRPFLFAIQHRASGACLFLGRVNDPR